MLVTLEGIDGAGKSTVIEKLEAEFEEAVFTKEPLDTVWTGKNVRRSISDSCSPDISVFFSFLQDHAYHVENVITPALEEGTLVISDRYIDSRYAYQSVALSETVDADDTLSWIKTIQEAGWSRFPDLTLYIDIDAQEAMSRVGGRESDAEKRFEKENKLEKIRSQYLRLLDSEERFKRIDGMQAENADENMRKVAEDCIEAIQSARNDS
jgi:dTMP kinase